MAMGIKPDLQDTHAWDSQGFVWVEGSNKLEAQADAAYFVGYNRQSKGYQMYWSQWPTDTFSFIGKGSCNGMGRGMGKDGWR